MKKVLATLLSIAMLLSLAACGGEKATEKKTEPTEEDLAAIGYYEKAINALDRYAETGGLAFIYADFGMESKEEYVNGQKALAEYYQLLTNLENVDQWVGTQYITNTDINWDRQAVLDSFVVVEGVFVDGTYTEKRPESEPTITSLADKIQYNQDGTVASFAHAIYQEDIWEVPYAPTIYTRDAGAAWTPEYDEAGRIVKLVNSSRDTATGELVIKATRSFTYDAEGKRIQENLKTQYWDIDYMYSYDDAGRLVQLSWNEDPQKNLTIDYTYDETGKLIRTVEKVPQRDSDGNFTILSETTCEYTYDDSGLLVGRSECGVHMEQGVSGLKDSQYPGWAVSWERTDLYSYTYDAMGRLQTKTKTYGDTYDYLGEGAGEAEPYSIETETYEYVFGDYYFYTPAN